LIGIISESSKENGQTHHEGIIVHIILNDLPLINMDFHTGLLHSQNTSSTMTFQITTTLSHFMASVEVKNLHSFMPRGRAIEKFSFHAKTLYCFFLSLYTTDHLQKYISVQIDIYLELCIIYFMSLESNFDFQFVAFTGHTTKVVTLRNLN
jgi:hypothetical protein